MENLSTYKVTFNETKDEWIFQYKEGVIYSFYNLKGTRILTLLDNNQFPGKQSTIEEWVKYKSIKVELVIQDYSFDAAWSKYNLKIKKEAAQKAYEKLNLIDKIKFFNKLPEYDAFLQRTGQAKAHMVTWINQKRYNDEYN